METCSFTVPRTYHLAYTRCITLCITSCATQLSAVNDEFLSEFATASRRCRAPRTRRRAHGPHTAQRTHASVPVTMRAWQGWHATPCYSCGRNLAYQSGAAVVKCPGCEAVLDVRGLPLSEIAGQTECTGCHQIIVFPAENAAGHFGLVCSTCGSYTQVPPSYFYNCRGCGLYVTYCARLRCVICSVCRTVYPPTPAPSPYPPLALAPLVPSLHRPQRPPPNLPPRRFALLRSTPVTAVPGPRPAPLLRNMHGRQRTAARPVPPEPPPPGVTARAPSHGVPVSASSVSEPHVPISHTGAPTALGVEGATTSPVSVGQQDLRQPSVSGEATVQASQPSMTHTIEHTMESVQSPSSTVAEHAQAQPHVVPHGRKLRWAPKMKAAGKEGSGSQSSAPQSPQQGQAQQSSPQQSQPSASNGEDTGKPDTEHESVNE